MDTYLLLQMNIRFFFRCYFKFPNYVMINISIVMSNICRLFIKPCFTSFQGRTAVKKNSYNPVWNEQIVFTEMFPPLCQRIKIQLRESATVGDAVVGTHYLDLSSISNDGDKGKLLSFKKKIVYTIFKKIVYCGHLTSFWTYRKSLFEPEVKLSHFLNLSSILNDDDKGKPLY